MTIFEIDGRTWETPAELDKTQTFNAYNFLYQEVAHVGHGCALDRIKDRRLGTILRMPDASGEICFTFTKADAGVLHCWPPQ